MIPFDGANGLLPDGVGGFRCLARFEETLLTTDPVRRTDQARLPTLCENLPELVPVVH